MSIPRYGWLDDSGLISDEVSGSGWDALLGQLLREIDVALAGTPARLHLQQAKEKFGSLRFYYRVESSEAATVDRIAKAVERAFHSSTTICFRCGAPATMRNMTGWIVPLCGEHVRVVAEERL